MVAEQRSRNNDPGELTTSTMNNHTTYRTAGLAQIPTMATAAAPDRVPTSPTDAQKDGSF